MTRARTGHAETCGAPICFERPGITDEPYFWYPGEDICGYHDVSPEQRHARRVQRRIERVWRALPPEPGFEEADIGYFTFDDLRHRRAVRRGVRGRDREAPRDTLTGPPVPSSLGVQGGPDAPESMHGPVPIRVP